MQRVADERHEQNAAAGYEQEKDERLRATLKLTGRLTVRLALRGRIRVTTHKTIPRSTIGCAWQDSGGFTKLYKLFEYSSKH